MSPRERPTPTAPDPVLVGRFAADLDSLFATDSRLGLAVSGGADSLALLLLATAARSGRIEAATVDHKLRPEAADEARMVARLCSRLGVPHSTLEAEWDERPASAIQKRARAERYRLLAHWAGERGLGGIATGHHLDDQAETLLMRLNRGAGVRGLAGVRPLSSVPGASSLALVRPLLGWRREELEAVCIASDVDWAADPSNQDEQFERVRVRNALAESHWLDAPALVRSAANLAAADEALDWAAQREWEAQVSATEAGWAYRPAAPDEIRRRVVGRIIETLASEGEHNPLRGREMDKLLQSLSEGATSTLRGVLCTGGELWRFAPAPKRS